MNELIKNVSAATPAAFSGHPVSPPPAREKPPRDEKETADQEVPHQLNLEELKSSIDLMADKAFSDSHLAIEKNEAAGVFVYRLIDSRNGSVMRQWPTEDFLSLREYLRSKQGGLVDQRI